MVVPAEPVIDPRDPKSIAGLRDDRAQILQRLMADLDEFDFAGLTRVASEKVKPPRVSDAAVAFECHVAQHLEIGTGRVWLSTAGRERPL